MDSQNEIPKLKTSEAQRLASRRYRIKNREKLNEYHRLWYSNNKEKHDSYRKKNKEPV